jgi:hypothetical protein
MKLKMLLLAAFAAGVFASIALASKPAGKGNPHASTSTSTSTGAKTSTTTTTTTTHGKKGKVLVCHKLPNGHYVLIRVSANSAPAKGKRHGDVLAGQGGTCPGPIQHLSTSTSTSTSTTTTTTHS